MEVEADELVEELHVTLCAHHWNGATYNIRPGLPPDTGVVVRRWWVEGRLLPPTYIAVVCKICRQYFWRPLWPNDHQDGYTEQE